MGYNSYISGDQRLDFSRPLTAGEVREMNRVVMATGYLSYFLQLDVQTQEIETDEGKREMVEVTRS